ncbi:MAG: methyltransferase domain-containing protein [Hyphomicrobium sp.]|uniref:class I SAM-dependent methyltransferase n=1 Tax=Hyphomicrobium sp. TaxID=82 RepID=UPI001322D1CD|nr:methyltransferase domain-containing protein [Hyphomicrobium sp.]KAB2942278.1 MAG: methyltransferase domain-containing protein [Hyphomicrobium sp.]MBZ0208421.1 methyltransferase domain-containing protein [Hyphomicrobium sp.]
MLHRAFCSDIVAETVVVASVLLAASGAQAQTPPYFPTSHAAVEKMLAMAEVKESDFLIDLGSGDGRIPITAAQRFGARGLGVDIDPQRIVEANDNARRAGVADKVTFRKENLFDTDIGRASVLTLYLSLKINIGLRPRILKEMRPGTRVLSNDFNMGDWLPDKWERVGDRVVYLWIVPTQVAGRWRLTFDAAEGARAADLKLAQQFQELSGSATIDGQAVPLRDGMVTGEQVEFVLDVGHGEAKRFKGRLVDGHLEGEGWRAIRQ